MADDKPMDARAREAEQYTLDFGKPPKPQPPAPDYAKPCGNLGYCYCPKCNPK